jgi:S1-C subfamily serine protease
LGPALLAVAFAAATCLAVADTRPAIGWLGVSIADVTEELADRLATTFGPAAGNGVLVVEVLKGGPAEQAALRRGDVIVGLDSQPIWDVRQLQRKIRAQPVDRRVVLTVLRETIRIQVPVAIGAMPVEARAQLAGERFGFLVRAEDGRESRSGPASPAPRVYVAFVDKDSPAARAGLQPTDVIREANGQPVRSLLDLDQAMAHSDRSVALVIERRGAESSLRLVLEAPAR